METKHSNSKESIKEAIAARNAMFATAMANKDAVGVSKCYTTDGAFMAGGSPSFVGRAAIEEAIAGFISEGFTKYEVLHFKAYNDSGIVGVQAEYNLSHADGSQLDNGKTIQLWKQEDGGWKIFRDCFNSNTSE